MTKQTKQECAVIIRLSAMGDVAMSTHAIEQLRKTYPTLQIVVVTNPFFAPLFSKIEGVEVFGADFKKQYTGFWAILNLFRDLRRRYQISVVMDIHDILRTKLLRKFFQATFCKVAIIDKGRRGKRDLCRKGNKILKPLKSTVQRYADCFAKGGYPIELDYKLNPQPEVMSSKCIEICGEKSQRWIGISPFAQHQGKNYPINLMEQVVESLCADPNNKIFLFGGGNRERELTENIAQKFENCTSIVGKISLSEELQLISNLNCMVAMDSSGAHLATLKGVPAITVWGATHPFAGFYAYGQSTEDIVQVDLDCRPCSVYGNKPCFKGTYECMNSITPQMIVDKVQRHL